MTDYAALDERNNDFFPTTESHLRELLRDALDENKRLNAIIRRMNKTIKRTIKPQRGIQLMPSKKSVQIKNTLPNSE